MDLVIIVVKIACTPKGAENTLFLWKTTKMTRDIAEMAAVWPLTQADLHHWWTHQQRKLEDKEYAAILFDLRNGVLTMTQARNLLGLEFRGSN